jgi:hypothetical protein
MKKLFVDAATRGVHRHLQLKGGDGWMVYPYLTYTLKLL